MAKKRRKSGRRRRIGAVALRSGSPVVKFGSLAAGYLLADKVQRQIEKLTGTLDPKIVNGIMAAGGLWYLFMFRGKKNPALSAVAGLAAGAGTKGLLSDFGVLSGFMSVPVVSGYGDVPAIGNYGVPSPASALNGVEGYTVPAGGVIGGVPDQFEDSGINVTDR